MKNLKNIVKKLRKEYPKGTRVTLIHMDDPYRRIPRGTCGTVTSVDDIATIHVNWDCGSSLGVIHQTDKVQKINAGEN